jgi:hypothetical protein
MRIHYQLFPELGLFVQKYVGEWSNEDYLAFLKVVSDKNYFQLTKKVLTDLREVTNLEIAYGSIKKLQEIRKSEHTENFANVQIVDSPSSTAIIHLYQMELSSKYKYSYCSTVRQAIILLDLVNTIDENEMLTILNNLEFQFN